MPRTRSSKYSLLIQAAERLREEARRAARGHRLPARSARPARPATRACCAALDRLYRAEQMWAELLENLRPRPARPRRRPSASGCARRSATLRERLEDPSDALEEYRRCSRTPPTTRGRSRPSPVGEAREELRLDAAESWSRCCAAPAIRRARRRARDAPRRADRPRRSRQDAARDRHGGRGLTGPPGDAEDVLLRALADTPDDASLYAEIERLAEPEGTPATPTRSRRARERSSTPPSRRISACGSARSPRRSSRTTAAASTPTSRPASTRATRRRCSRRSTGSTARQDDTALADVLERRVPVETGAKEQADLFHRLAVIQIESSARSPAASPR